MRRHDSPRQRGRRGPPAASPGAAAGWDRMLQRDARRGPRRCRRECRRRPRPQRILDAETLTPAEAGCAARPSGGRTARCGRLTEIGRESWCRWYRCRRRGRCGSAAGQVRLTTCFGLATARRPTRCRCDESTCCGYLGGRSGRPRWPTCRPVERAHPARRGWVRPPLRPADPAADRQRNPAGLRPARRTAAGPPTSLHRCGWSRRSTTWCSRMPSAPGVMSDAHRKRLFAGGNGVFPAAPCWWTDSWRAPGRRGGSRSGHGDAGDALHRDRGHHIGRDRGGRNPGCCAALSTSKSPTVSFLCRRLNSGTQQGHVRRIYRWR